MSQVFWGLYSELDHDLTLIDSLIKGARCVRDREENANVETDLISLAEDLVGEGRELLKQINQEYRKLEKEKKEPDQPA